MRFPFKFTTPTETIPFQIPLEWDDITVREYFEIMSMPDSADELDLLEIVTKIPKNKWSCTDDFPLFAFVRESLLFLYQPMPDISEVGQFIHYDGKTYPIMKDLGYLSIGQWKDIEKMCLIPIQTIKKPIETIQHGVLLAAIYLQPHFDLTVHEKVNGRKHEYSYVRALAIAEKLWNMPIVDMMRLQAFFFLKTTEYAKSIEAYSKQKQAETALKPELTSFTKDGGSISPIRRWLGRFTNWMRS